MKNDKENQIPAANAAKLFEEKLLDGSISGLKGTRATEHIKDVSRLGVGAIRGEVYIPELTEEERETDAANLGAFASNNAGVLLVPPMTIELSDALSDQKKADFGLAA